MMKTLEEKAIEYGLKVYKELAKIVEESIDGALMSAAANGFIAGAEHAQQWTSVKEGMPMNDSSMSYLVRVSYQDHNITRSKTAMPVKGSGEVVSIGHHDAFSGRWYILHVTLGDWEVTHWRPIDL